MMPDAADPEWNNEKIKVHSMVGRRMTREEALFESKNNETTSITYEIVTKAREEYDKFIFETLRPYCEETVKMEISKKDLEEALTMWKNRNEEQKVHSMVYRACVDRNCKYSRLIFIKRPGTPKGKGTAVCGLGWTEEDCDKLKEG